MNMDAAIGMLIAYAEKHLFLDARDAVYARNRVLELLGRERYDAEPFGELPELPSPILGAIFSCLAEEGKDYDAATLGERLMDAVMLRPSEYEREFAANYGESPRAATDRAYEYAVRSDYVKKSAIDKNIKWSAENGLEITINLSKPEKDNKDLQKQLHVQSTSYPLCAICRENEGYERPGFSRRNMRTLSLRLGGEDWFWQYSPYAYFNEHGIAVSARHTPMKLDEGTAGRLFDFVDLFPHYFIGNNAPLPRVGGSILAHDHYQGGRAVLPMQRAGVCVPLYSEAFPSVRAGVIDWHNTALRFEGEDRRAIEGLAFAVASAWKTYQNPALDILPFTGEEPHNTASFIARRTQGGYILDVILRNNRTSGQYPDGIFHAHRERHHIKSESIGLIEAMGLFILPARLKRQLGEVKQYLTGERAYAVAALSEDMRIFAPMIGRLLSAHGRLSAAEADAVLKSEVEETCRAILGDTAVFKRTEEGRTALLSFLAGAGLKATGGK